MHLVRDTMRKVVADAEFKAAMDNDFGTPEAVAVLFELAERLRVPVVFFTEGGGGRPGDTDGSGVAGLDCLAFNYFAKLSGLVPLTPFDKAWTARAPTIGGVQRPGPPLAIPRRALFILWALFWILMWLVAFEDNRDNAAVRWWEPLLARPGPMLAAAAGGRPPSQGRRDLGLDAPYGRSRAGARARALALDREQPLSPPMRCASLNS